MEQASGKPLRALLIPGRTRTRLLVGRGEALLASFSMTGPVVEVAVDLVEMVAGSFDVGVVLVDAGGFQAKVLSDPGVVGVCGRLGLEMVALAPASSVRS